jgi:hypothetical protein
MNFWFWFSIAIVLAMLVGVTFNLDFLQGDPVYGKSGFFGDDFRLLFIALCFLIAVGCFYLLFYSRWLEDRDKDREAEMKAGKRFHSGME